MVGLEQVVRILGRLTRLSARFARDHSGNTLAIVAVSMLPILAVIGSAIDLSRAYMVRSQLHQACDAGVLAGRRVMNGNSNRTTDAAAVRAEALKFFNYDFPVGRFGTVGQIVPTITPVYTIPYTVNGTAATNLPTYFMQIFGYTQMPIAVNCTATQNYNNIDIVLVLDVTGSMGSQKTSDGIYRIDALKNAAKALYNQLQGAKSAMEAATPVPLKMRISVVPYANTVNVGKLLYAANPSYIRRAVTPYYTTSNASWGGSSWSNTGAPDRYLMVDTTGYVNAGIADTAGTNPYAWQGCIEERSTDPTITGTQDPTSIPLLALDLQFNPPSTAQWTPFLAVPQDSISTTPGVSYKSASLLNDYLMPPNSANANVKSSFNAPGSNGGSSALLATGVAPTTYTYDPAKPYPAIAAASLTGNGPNGNCPNPALGLNVYSESDFDTYIDSLTTGGGTLHDIGMIWGLRMISPNLPFSNSLPTNNYPLNRFIIFMSDGYMSSGLSSGDTAVSVGGIYSAWGLEASGEKRVGGSVTPSNSDSTDARHTTRFLMACNAAKTFVDSQNNPLTQIFTIALGTSSMPASMASCASSSDQQYTTNSGNDLTTIFQQIAAKIGKLRLSQ